MFYIAGKDSKDRRKPIAVPVNGYWIKGFKGRFFTHKSRDYDGKWVVTEATTGRKLPLEYRTRADATVGGRAFIEENMERIKEQIKNMPKITDMQTV